MVRRDEAKRVKVEQVANHCRLLLRCLVEVGQGFEYLTEAEESLGYAEASGRLAGLQEALRDLLRGIAILDPGSVALLEECLQRRGRVSLKDMMRESRVALDRVARRGAIRTDAEYREIRECLSLGLVDAEKGVAYGDLMRRYEEGKPVRSRRRKGGSDQS